MKISEQQVIMKFYQWMCVYWITDIRDEVCM